MLPQQETPKVSYMQSSSYVYDKAKKKFGSHTLQQDQKAQQFLDRFSENRSETIQQGLEKQTQINRLKDPMLAEWVQKKLQKMGKEFAILQLNLVKIKERQLNPEQQQFILDILERHGYTSTQPNQKLCLAQILKEIMKKQRIQKMPRREARERKYHRYEEFQLSNQQSDVQLRTHQLQEMNDKHEKKNLHQQTSTAYGAKILKGFQIQNNRYGPSRISFKRDHFFDPLILAIEKLDTKYFQGKIGKIYCQVYYRDVLKVIIRNNVVSLEISALGQIQVKLQYFEIDQVSLLALIYRIQAENNQTEKCSLYDK